MARSKNQSNKKLGQSPPQNFTKLNRVKAVNKQLPAKNVTRNMVKPPPAPKGKRGK